MSRRERFGLFVYLTDQKDKQNKKEPIWPLPEKLHRLPIQSGSTNPRVSQRRRRPAPAAADGDGGDEDGDVGPFADADDVWGVDHGSSENEGGEEEASESEEEDEKEQDHPEPPPAHPDPRRVRLQPGQALWGRFGGHAIIQLKSGGFSIWCERHSNLTDDYKCKADCSGALSDAEKLLRLKRWCVLGFSVDE